jgi:two-component sensor histidine kinase
MRVKQLTKGLKAADIDEKITIKYDIDAIMRLDKAVIIELIINELVLNAIEHAFDEKGGEINIVLHQGYLQISDNGKGFDKEKISQESLGLQLVKSLVRS